MAKCSELSSTVAAIALNMGSRPEVRTLDDVVAAMQKEMPEFNREQVVGAIVEASTGHEQTITALGGKLSSLKREARRDVGLRNAITGLEQHLQGGTIPGSRLGPARPTPDAIVSLTERRDALLKAVRSSDPALRQRYERQIDQLTEQLQANSIAPRVKRDAIPMSKDVQRLAYQRDRLRQEINSRVQSMKPKSVWSHIAEPFNAARAVMTSFDLSAVFRQGGVISLSHPVRAARSVVPMLRAFASEQASHQINHEILNRPNAPLYAKSKLYLSPTDGTPAMSAMEEAYMSRWAKKIPLVKGSERAYVTFLNKLRADSFDTMAATLARGGEPTLPETQAISNYINVATGRGKLGALEPAATALNTVFFAPRNMASRFQLLAGQPLYGGTGSTRAMIATEYGRFLIGLGVVYALGAAAGGKLEDDPRSANFGKIRFGNTRLDPLAGLGQTATLVSRVATGKTKSATTGAVTPLRGEGVPFGGRGTFDVMSSFLRSKLSPMAGTAVDVASGENAVGQPVTPSGAAANLATPLAFKDIYGAMTDQGVPRGTALSLLGILGMGLQTYGKDPDPRMVEKEQKAQSKIERREPLSAQAKDYIREANRLEALGRSRTTEEQARLGQLRGILRLKNRLGQFGDEKADETRKQLDEEAAKVPARPH